MENQVVSYSRPKTLGALIVTEYDPLFSRLRGVLLAGSGSVRSVAQFSVLGQRTLATPASAAKSGGNTGTGTFVLDATAPLLADAIPGIYKLRWIAADTNAGTARLTDPKGRVLADYAYDGSGATFTTDRQIKGVFTDANDMAVGDGFDITVGAGDGKLTALNLAKADGTQNAAGVSLFDASAADGTDDVVDYLEGGPVVVRAEELVWPDGITDAQKAAATAQLRALGIKVVTSG